MLIWNVTKEQANSDYRSWSMHSFLPGIVELLEEEGENIGLVILSVKDASDKEVSWSFKKRLLAPLAELAPTVTFTLGEVTAADEEEGGLKQHLQGYVDELNARSRDAGEGSKEG